MSCLWTAAEVVLFDHLVEEGEQTDATPRRNQRDRNVGFEVALGRKKCLGTRTTRARPPTEHHNEGLPRPSAFFQFCKNLVHVESCRLLTLWILPERRQELTDVRLRGDKKEGVIY